MLISGAWRQQTQEIEEEQMEGNINKVGSSSSSDDLNPCPICLGPVVQECYLDKCLHKFCYNCILHWTKVVASKHSSLLSLQKTFRLFMDMMEVIFKGITLIKHLGIVLSFQKLTSTDCSTITLNQVS
ncbi:hypothetical protein LWI29_005475 [Acer saccharum]|uniref:Zinc finger C3HC4 RING-type domain-containing protein n=1 Tax=Acer saccharum TaxID=4024 RepID=A0AA39T178_ACESA|nr:hypothetical protein LWI29_005475 [Acer saccharum]